jgi:sugar phosphate isomerase/epimerase
MVASFSGLRVMSRIPSVYASSGAFLSRALPDLFDEAAAAGVTHIELSSGVAWQADNLASVRANRRRFRFLVHNYFPPPEVPFVLNLGSADPEIRRLSLDHCRGAIDLAHELETDLFTVHAGFALEPKVSELGRPITGEITTDLETCYRIFRDSVGSLVAYGEKSGVDLGIENNVVAPFNLRDGRNTFLLMATAEEIVRLMTDIASPHLGVLIDSGHLNVSARSLGFEREGFLETVRPWLLGWHLSDNDGTADSNKPFGPEAWFLPWVAKAPGRMAVVEAYRLKPAALDGCLRAVSAAVAGLKEGPRDA